MTILSGQSILITRPEPFGAVLCESVIENGGRAWYLPTIAFLPPRDLVLLEQQFKQLDQFQWALFISPQAVAASIDWLNHYKLPSPTFKIGAVGLGTANALKARNFPVTIYPQHDWSSEGLLALPDMQNIKGQKIAIFKGEGGREVLQEKLLERGAYVEEIVTYQRSLPNVNVTPFLDLVQNNQIDKIVCTSEVGLRNLKLLLQSQWGKLQKIPLIVISLRMMELAKTLGFSEIKLAENASHDAIIRVCALSAKEAK